MCQSNPRWMFLKKEINNYCVRDASSQCGAYHDKFFKLNQNIEIGISFESNNLANCSYDSSLNMACVREEIKWSQLWVIIKFLKKLFPCFFVVDYVLQVFKDNDFAYSERSLLQIT